MKSTDFIIHSRNPEENAKHVNHIRSCLEEHGFVYNEKDPSLIIVLGGDGSLMRAIHFHQKRGMFVLINTGHLGFYSDYGIQELEEFLDNILHHEPMMMELPLLQVNIDGKVHDFVNDVAIQSGETCFLNLYINGEPLTNIRCNGIVVSSPIGTTGYLTSLGSPVVIGQPDIYQYAIIAPCYNALSLNPINKAILQSDQVLTVEVQKGEIDCYIDGGRKREDCAGKVFHFTRDKGKNISLLHFKKITQTKRLRKNISGKED